MRVHEPSFRNIRLPVLCALVAVWALSGGTAQAQVLYGSVVGTVQDASGAVVPGASVYPFVWNILLSARAEGFGGTITTLVVSQEPKVQELLGIPAHVAVAAVMPLGRPVKQLTRLRRKAVPEFSTRERWDGPPLAAPGS